MHGQHFLNLRVKHHKVLSWVCILSCIQAVDYTVPAITGFLSLSVPSVNYNRLCQSLNNRTTWDGACNPMFWIPLYYLKKHFHSSFCRSWAERGVGRMISERIQSLLLKTNTSKHARHYCTDRELNCLYFSLIPSVPSFWECNDTEGAFK